MKRKSFAAFAAAAAVFALATASSTTPSRAQDPGITDKEIVIGMFGPLSGPLIAYGIDPSQAAKMLYEEANKKGGVHGRKIRLIVEDDKCSPNDIVSVVKKFVTVDKVFMLHGGSCTAAISAAVDYINREKIPYAMLNAAGDNAVFPPTRYVFGSFQGTQRAYAAAFAEFGAKHLKAKRAAVIVHDDEYGKANAAMAKATFEKLGVEVVAIERIPPNISDVTAPMLKIREAKPDVILSGAYPAPAVLIAQKYAEFGMTAIPLLQAAQGIPTPSVFAKNVANPAALENFYYTWAFNDIGDAAVKAKYTDLFKSYNNGREPGPFMMSGIPSAVAVLAALEAAGPNLTREGFVNAMEKLNLKFDAMPGPLQFGPKRRDAARTMVIIKYDGKTQKVMPGAYAWDGVDAPTN
jgi:branched-chain amino acid transport system substrate-binding protein